MEKKWTYGDYIERLFFLRLSYKWEIFIIIILRCVKYLGEPSIIVNHDDPLQTSAIEMLSIVWESTLKLKRTKHNHSAIKTPCFLCVYFHFDSNMYLNGRILESCMRWTPIGATSFFFRPSSQWIFCLFGMRCKKCSTLLFPFLSLPSLNTDSQTGKSEYSFLPCTKNECNYENVIKSLVWCSNDSCVAGKLI